MIHRSRHDRQILASLDHPNIAGLYDGGTTSDGLPYFVMEHVEGVPIDRYADERRLTTAARVELCLPILDALQHAHDRHVVHRDLKPNNVLVTRDGVPKLLDFGIAKLLEPGAPGASTFTGVARPMTPDYASPEQLGAARRHHEQALAVRVKLNETRTIMESRAALAELALEEGRPADAEEEARRLASTLAADTGALRFAVEVLAARALLARGDVRAAERTLIAARRLGEKSERIDVRTSLVLAEASLDAARGRTEAARERLLALRAQLSRSGMVLAELECRALLARIDRREDAAALARDARARNAGLILRRLGIER